MLRNVVVGIDGSEYARRALEWAVREVSEQVHAVHALSPSRELLAAGFQIDTAPLVHRLRAKLEGEWTAGIDRSGPLVQTRLVEDSPARAMLWTADDVHADAIAVGVRGLESSSRLVGATTSQLVHLSTRPVVVVPSVDDDTSAGSAMVLVAVAGHGQDDAELLRWAAMAARDEGTKLRVVHADTRASAKRANAGSSAAAHRLEDWLAAQDVGRDCDLEVVAADPITALVDASRDAALLVVGSHRSTRLAAYLTGALANHLPTVSHCPVAMVPLTATRP